MRLQAPAKLNLCLFLGPRRPDGLHSLCSLFEPLGLADRIEVEERDRIEPGGRRRIGAEASAGGGAAVDSGDEVHCPGVEGENLAARALAALRKAGWDGPPLQVRIEKRIPVAAGLGGGSADAAAILRLARLPGDRDTLAPGRDAVEPARSLAGGEVPDLEAIAFRLGADVPSQLVPALSLVRGAGELVEQLPQPRAHAAVLLPGGGGLSTAEVFAAADSLGLGRGSEELDELADQLRDAAGSGASPLAYAELLGNDLEPAACALRPEIGETLEALRAAGAAPALLTGSGPTAFGLFSDLAAARSAAEWLDRDDAIVCEAGQAP